MRAVLYTRAGCHLCDDAAAVLRAHGFNVEEIDIDRDPALVERYGLAVPVVLIDGKERFRGRVDPVLLRRLASTQAQPTAPRMQISLLQMMKLMAFIGAACACVAMMVQIPMKFRGDDGEIRWSLYFGLAAAELILIPLAWAILALLLVRQGRFKDTLIVLLLLCSVSTLLVIIATILFVDPEPMELSVLIILIATILFLLGSAVFLVTRLYRRYRRLLPASESAT